MNIRQQRRFSHFLQLVGSLCLTFAFMLPPNRVQGAAPQATFKAEVNGSEQCAQGFLLFLQGRLNEAQPALQAGVDTLQKTLQPNATILGRCALFLGIVHHNAGEWVEALTAYQLALARFRQVGDQQLTWGTEFAMGAVYMAQGRQGEAYNTLHAALTLLDQSSATPWLPENIKPVARAVNLSNVGTVVAAALMQQSGELPPSETYTTTRAYFQEALTLLEPMRNPAASQQDVLTTFLDLLGEQLHLAEADKATLRNFLSLLGVQDNLTEADRALLQSLLPLLTTMAQGQKPPDLDTILNQALGGLVGGIVPELARAITPLILNNIGESYRAQGQSTAARAYYTQAFAQVAENRARPPTAQQFTPLFDFYSEAILSTNLGLVELAEGNVHQARTDFTRALALFQDKLGNSAAALNLHVNLGYLDQQAGNLAQASRHYEAAMAQLDDLRTIAEGGAVHLFAGGDFRAWDTIALQGALAQAPDVYALATNAYLRQGKTTAALQTMERGRARLFLDLLSQGNPHLPAADATLLTNLQATFNARMYATLTLKQLQALPQPDRAQIANWQTQLQQAEKSYKAQLTKLQAQQPPLADLAPGIAFTLNITEAQQYAQKTNSTLVIYYATEGKVVEPKNELAVAWVVDETGVKLEKLGANGATLRRESETLRDQIEAQAKLLTNPDKNLSDALGQETKQTLATLYEYLIKPLQADLHKENLVIIPYGTLHYLPFAALWDAQRQRYLVQDHTLTYAPSLSTLRYLPANTNPYRGQFLALGNPDRSLPNAEAGAQAAAQLFGVKPLLRQQATRAALTTQGKAKDILHIAAHGVYSASTPLASYLALAPTANDDGRLTVQDVFGLRLNDANLVVLSACETNVGSVSNGDEITSLTRAFLYAGAPALVTTQWKIEATASSLLTTTFYTHLRQGETVAKALQQAQLTILQTYPSPFYWAAFAVHGAGHEAL